nr:hypothetical protein [Streptomyces sp. NRRL WC-3723]
MLLGEAEGLVGDLRGVGDQPGADARALKKTVTAALESIGRRPAA